MKLIKRTKKNGRTFKVLPLLSLSPSVYTRRPARKISRGRSDFIERDLFFLAFLPLLIGFKLPPFLELLIVSRTFPGFLPILILLELLEIR
jgi:hypothetical protein